jgi:hypothetical protein
MNGEVRIKLELNTLLHDGAKAIHTIAQESFLLGV